MKKIKPSIMQITLVRQMKACGETDDTIAKALEIPVVRLRTDFKYHLDHAVAFERRRVIQWLFTQAAKGNMMAIARLDNMTVAQSPKVRLAPQRIGKKQIQQASAQNAHEATEWDRLIN